jgi:hypothetical protein
VDSVLAAVAGVVEVVHVETRRIAGLHEPWAGEGEARKIDRRPPEPMRPQPPRPLPPPPPPVVGRNVPKRRGGGACAAELERCSPPDMLGLRVTGWRVDRAMSIWIDM